jgi:hypothetical protein
MFPRGRNHITPVSYLALRGYESYYIIALRQEGAELGLEPRLVCLGTWTGGTGPPAFSRLYYSQQDKKHLCARRRETSPQAGPICSPQ